VLRQALRLRQVQSLQRLGEDTVPLRVIRRLEVLCGIDDGVDHHQRGEGGRRFQLCD